MPLNWVVLIVFLLAYGFLCASKHHRAKALWIGIGLMVLARYTLCAQDPKAHLLSVHYVLFDAIEWNILGILAGAMMLAELFSDSKVPLLLADHLADHCRSTHTALLAVCILSGFISVVVDNVTTVLLVAPVALVVAKRVNVTPAPFLIGIAISSNLQGAATLIGDPPSMLLAGEFDLTFNSFFFHKTELSQVYKPSMFFIIQAGAVASFAVLYWIFRRYRRPMTPVEKVKPTSWIPTGMIAVMITFLALSSVFDPKFIWLAGTGNVILGSIGLLWMITRNRQQAKNILKRYDLPTIFFLAAIFVFAKAMFDFDWIEKIKDIILATVGNNRFMAFTVIVWFSVVVSAFIDNIAYIGLMLPVVKTLAADPSLGGLGGEPFLYAAGLLVGSCLGGNITPIGAACNVAAVGILRKEGHHISFWDFAKIGLPFTLAATAAGWLATWFIWG